MARYQVRDSQTRKINVIEWDGKSDLGQNYNNCSITLDDGSPLWVAPPVVVTRRQMMLALNAQGKLASVNSIVANADITVQLSWAEAVEFHRTDDMLIALSLMNGWSDNDLDQLFQQASKF